MKTQSIRAFVIGPALFAAAVGLAVTASGCIVDTGQGYSTSCQSDLSVGWEIENASNTPVTCAAAGAATVVVSLNYSTPNRTDYPKVCSPTLSSDSLDIFLSQNNTTYDVTVNLYDASGNALATPQETSASIGSCGSYTIPGYAPLVLLSSPAQ